MLLYDSKYKPLFQLQISGLKFKLIKTHLSMKHHFCKGEKLQGNILWYSNSITLIDNDRKQWGTGRV